MTRTKFTFHFSKPKGEMLGTLFREGCRAVGHSCVLTSKSDPVPGTIGVFYGVMPSTYAAFRYYMAQRQAVYFDNGWLSTPKRPTFRFAWNAAQPFLADLDDPVEDFVARHGYPPEVKHDPVRGRALLVLQSRQYFDYMRLGYSRDAWEGRMTRLLKYRGYTVETREKPNKRDKEAETLFDQMGRAEIVVSLNSAACLKALRNGIPAFCTLDCSLTPLAPVAVPEQGYAHGPLFSAVETMCSLLAGYEVTKDQLKGGEAIRRLLAVHETKRRGYFYGFE